MDLALNNLQRLICHKTKQTKQTNQIPMGNHQLTLVWKTVKKNDNNYTRSLNKFPDFFRMSTFIDSTHMKL